MSSLCQFFVRREGKIKNHITPSQKPITPKYIYMAKSKKIPEKKNQKIREMLRICKIKQPSEPLKV